MHTHTSHDAPHAHAHHGFAHPQRNVAALGVEPGMVVADFGAGGGAYVRAIAEVLGGDGYVYAIDVQQDLLRRIHNDAVRRHHENIRIIWGDLERPGGSKLADESVDLVLISNLLFQIENKIAVLAEARRIVKPAGRLALIDWSDSFGGLGPQRDNAVTKDAALALSHEAGFELAREFPAGAHHWGLICTIANSHASV